jgi:predicted ATPase
MIKRLQVKNFRSIKDLDLTLSLNNVLVGPNASGKSNLLDVFGFLTQIGLLGVNRALTDRFGFPEVAWKGREPGPIHILLDIETAGAEKDQRLEYEIEVDGTATGLITLRRERLTLTQHGSSVDLIDFQSGHGLARRADGSKAFDSPGNPSQSALEFNVPGWEGTQFKEYLTRWQFHRLDPQLMKQINPAGRALFLRETGDNLASWLATLKTSYSEQFRRIEQAAKDAFPGLEEILTELTQFQTTFLSSRDKYLNRPVHVWGLSGGELCFIAFASLILCPPELAAPLHCIEEVENHLNPRLIETLIKLLMQWQAIYSKQGGAAQLFVTTHSPYVVDQFDIGDLIIVEKFNGETRTLRASDKAHLRRLLEDQESGLGDLWYSGALGGI